MWPFVSRLRHRMPTKVQVDWFLGPGSKLPSSVALHHIRRGIQFLNYQKFDFVGASQRCGQVRGGDPLEIQHWMEGGDNSMHQGGSWQRANHSGTEGKLLKCAPHRRHCGPQRDTISSTNNRSAFRGPKKKRMYHLGVVDGLCMGVSSGHREQAPGIHSHNS